MTRKDKRNARADKPSPSPRRFPLWGVAMAVAAVAILLGTRWFFTHDSDTPVSTAPVTAVVPKADYPILKGRWVRPDGGYVIDVRSVDASGTMDAAYFNPQPIHVAKAEASRDGEAVKLFIELRDVNYPGSTYHLTYDAASDRLAGSYFQAALKETFDVFFTRLPP